MESSLLKDGLLEILGVSGNSRWYRRFLEHMALRIHIRGSLSFRFYREATHLTSLDY